MHSSGGCSLIRSDFSMDRPNGEFDIVKMSSLSNWKLEVLLRKVEEGECTIEPSLELFPEALLFTVEWPFSPRKNHSEEYFRSVVASEAAFSWRLLGSWSNEMLSVLLVCSSRKRTWPLVRWLSSESIPAGMSLSRRRPLSSSNHFGRVWRWLSVSGRSGCSLLCWSVAFDALSSREKPSNSRSHLKEICGVIKAQPLQQHLPRQLFLL